MFKFILILLFVGVRCAPPSVREQADDDLKSNKLFPGTEADKKIEKIKDLPSSKVDENDLKYKKIVVDSAKETAEKHENLETLEKVKPPQVDKPQLIPRKQPDLVRRPDHLDAVPIERDGGLNKNYRQEILFGDRKNLIAEDKNGEEKKTSKEKSREPEKLLKEVFTR